MIFKRYKSALLVIAFIFGITSFEASAQTRRMYDLGAAGTALKLKRLQTTARVMLTAAHPDDEDTALIAYLARNRAAAVAYYSVTRGDGGQNVIGNELSSALGVIRTEELLQARILDGGDQFFGSAIDYGFSKTLDEAKKMWPVEQQLSDMVRAIRLYRPHIIVSRFSGTDADGHGHHQMAGYLTPLAFAAAGKEDAFPEHFKEGLRPWQPLKLYRGHGFMPDDNEKNLLAINTGEYDGLTGRSYFEIAMQSRSRHRSQEMGAAELRGPQYSRLRLIANNAGEIEKENDIFDGIDTSIAGLSKLHKVSDKQIVAKLSALQLNAQEAINIYNVYQPEKVLPILAQGHKIANEIANAANAGNDIQFKNAAQQLVKNYVDAILANAGIVIDPLSNIETLNPGATALVSVNIFSAQPNMTEVIEAKVVIPNEWKTEAAKAPAQQPATNFRPRGEQPFKAAYFNVTASEKALPTQPYWLEKPLINANFDWSNSGDARNLPFADPILYAAVKLKVAGEEIHIKREIQHRFTDRIEGENRRQLKVEPAVTIGIDADHFIVPTDRSSETKRISVSVISNSNAEQKGILRPQMPAGWRSLPESAEVTLKNKGAVQQLEFDIIPANNIKAGSYPIKFVFDTNGKQFSLQKQTINYPHIQPHNIYSDAVVNAQVIDLKTSPVKVGYIMGSGDKMPEAIRRMGLQLEMIEQNQMSSGDLSLFDTIVVGIRASQTRQDMIANNSRLIDYVEKGGNLVVLYQQQEYLRFGLAPFTASMAVPPGRRPRVSNLRTTDENAPVKILDEGHMLFNYPNKIVNSDWDNWVQERSLYCLTEYDERYTPLLESHDEGEDENKGCMMYAKIGKGNYLYTSFSWFRQLPTGNPGAYRLFANILSMKK